MNEKLILAALVLGFCTLPVFRSGGRTSLTGLGWLKNHTIWGPPIEYVPEEDYACELEGVAIAGQARIPHYWGVKETMRFYKISRGSASELLQHQRGIEGG